MTPWLYVAISPETTKRSIHNVQQEVQIIQCPIFNILQGTLMWMKFWLLFAAQCKSAKWHMASRWARDASGNTLYSRWFACFTFLSTYRTFYSSCTFYFIFHMVSLLQVFIQQLYFVLRLHCTKCWSCNCTLYFILHMILLFVCSVSGPATDDKDFLVVYWK